MPLDFVSQVHEAAYSPSPLVGLLQDPYVVRSLARRRSRSRSSRRPSTSATAPERGRREDKENDSMSVLTVVLAEEERQVNHLRALLRTTAERLEDERVRANQAENRADFNESRVRELQMKFTNSEATKHSADLETERARDESHRLKMQMDMLEREVQRLRHSLSSMTKRKDEAEREASEAQDMTRKAEQRLREYEAEQEGRDEGRRLAGKKNYDAGWRECWSVAHEKGRTQGYDEGHGEGFAKGRSEAKLTFYEEGRKKGKLEGYQEGLERGTKEERERALEEFDRFLEQEISGSVHERVSRNLSILPSHPSNGSIARPSTTMGVFSRPSGRQNSRTAQPTSGHERKQQLSW
jgi:chromosome segregation ATPase